VYFNLSGNIPVFSIILQIYVSGDTMYGALSFSIRIEISSYPLEFLDFKDFYFYMYFTSLSMLPILFSSLR